MILAIGSIFLAGKSITIWLVAFGRGKVLDVSGGKGFRVAGVECGRRVVMIVFWFGRVAG